MSERTSTFPGVPMRRFLLATALFAATPALADQRFEATLAGHAMLPAATFVAPPEGAPPGPGWLGVFQRLPSSVVTHFRRESK